MGSQTSSTKEEVHSFSSLWKFTVHINHRSQSAHYLWQRLMGHSYRILLSLPKGSTIESDANTLAITIIRARQRRLQAREQVGNQAQRARWGEGKVYQ